MSIEGIFQVTLILAVFLCSLAAGLLFTFAIVVMPGIRVLNDREFIRAFQVIDGVIQNNQPVFMLVWVGSVIFLGLAAVLGIVHLDGIDRLLMIIAALVYLLGVQLPTARINIPLNNELQSLNVDKMSEQSLDTLANVAVDLAGFSGVVVAFRVRGARTWTPTELRVLWFLIGDSFLVLFFALLPLPMSLANWSTDVIWGVCNALLGTWFLVGFSLALRGERRDRAAKQWITVPVITPALYGIYVAALVMGIVLLLSVLGFFVPRSQAVYVLGLIVLLAFAAVEFMYFIGLMSQQDGDL